MAVRIDTHTHFYDPSRDQGIPWPPADNELLYRTCLPQHHRALAEPCGITGTVVVEASAWVEDNRWILDLGEREPWIAGFIGHIDPGDDFDSHLDHHADHPLFLGLRFGGGHFDEESAAVDAAIGALASRDLTLDVLIRGRQQVVGVARIAAAYPDLRIVVNHVAHVPIDGAAPDPEWVEWMGQLASHPQVYVKVSGFVELSTEQPAPTDPQHYQATFTALLDAYGGDRLVFGSNWPVCERAAPLAAVVGAVEAFVGEHPGLEENIWWKNAKAAYRFDL